MAKAYIHAQLSAKQFGGIMEDYLPIHQLLDSSKTAFADNRHRALTHNSWFINTIIPKVFGEYIINSEVKKISTIEIAEQHILDDFGGEFIPTAQDYLQEMNITNWMNGIGIPSSRILIEKTNQKEIITFNNGKI